MRLLYALALSILSVSAHAGVERMTLYAGESKVLELPGLKRWTLGNPSVADLRPLDENQALFTAKDAGQTSLLVWDRLGAKRAYEVEVLAHGLKKALIEIDVQVLEIAGGTQWDLGLDWAGAQAGLASVPGVPASPLAIAEQAPPPLLYLGAFQRGPLSARIEALVHENKARIMAKPRLVTVSGSKAKFLSGGQVPVSQPDKDGRASTQYKDYGISLEVEPRADEEGNVSAHIRAELSDIDPANSVSIGNGGVLPAVKSRWVETTIFVKKNATLVLAGLLQEKQGTVTVGIPILSQIPLLGELFKHHQITRRNDELVIFMTPKVVP